MALSDRDIIITPNRGAGSEPIITLRGADTASSATMVMRVINSGTVSTLSFEGTSGQLFAVSDTFAGTIFSVNDVSGIPSLEVLDSGEIKLAEYNGFVNIKGTTNATSVNSGVLRVAGGVGIAQDVYIGGTLNVTGTLNAAVIAGSITNAANVAVTNDPSNSATMYPTFVSATSGNQAIRIDSTGLVWIPSTNRLGIGTTTPVGPLHVVTGAGASDANTVILQRTAASDYSAISFRTGTTTDWSIGHNSNGGLSIFEAGAAATTRMVVKAGGNVGIGTTAPGSKLHIFTATPASATSIPTGTDLLIDSNTNSYLTFRQSSDLGIYGGLQWVDNNVGGYIVFRNFTSLGTAVGSDSLIYGTYQDHIFQAGTSSTVNGKPEVMRITQAGNVGIGDATPTQKLVVAGSAVITGGIFGAEAGAPDARIWAVSPANPTWGIFYNEGTPDYIEFQTAGTVSSRIALDSGAAHFGLSGGGRVGIGTGTPNTRLHIFQDGFANNTVNPLITLDGKFNVVTVDNNDIVAIASRIENNAGGSQTTNIIGSGFQTSFNSLLLQPNGGNVGVNNINPGRALDVTGVTNVSSHITQGPLISRPNVSWGASGTSTGAVVIRFPGGSGNYGMVHIVIDIYTYDGENASTLIIGGHNWNGSWYNFGATRIGAFSKGVRVAFKDGQYAVVLGTNTSTWSYGQVVVRKIQNGSYYSGVMDLGGTYTIAQDASAESYTYISSNLITTGSAGGGGWNSGNDGSGSGLDADLLDGLDSTAFLRRDVTNTMFAGQTSSLAFENQSTFFRFAFNELRFYDNQNGDIFGLNEHAYATTSMRAPIFYDRDDTAYYVNPNSESRLWYTSVNVGQESTGGANSSNAGLVLRGNYNSNTWAHKFHKFDNGGGVPLYLSKTVGTGAWTAVQGWGNGLTYDSQIFGSLGATSSVYSPIFYDLDNTAYYTDPASTSNLFNLQLTGGSNKYLYINPGNGYEAMVRYNGGSGSGWYVGKRVSSQVVGTESFHFYSEAAGQTVGGIDTSGNLFSIGSVRSPIFYDSNNTGYYTDPASTSVVNNLTVNGTLTYTGTLAAGVDYARRLDNHTRTAFIVGGNASTFYPVVFQLGSGATAQQYGEFMIERGGYDDPGYTGVNFSTMNARFSHKASGWGFGSTYENCEALYQNVQLIANWQQVSESSRMIIWLRGATQYHFYNIVGNTTLFNANAAGGNIVESNPAFYTYTFTPTTTVNAKAQHSKYFNGGAFFDGNSRIRSLGVGTNASGTDGRLDVSADVRAPIYYDSNDTTYYVNPASGSRLGYEVAISGNASGSVGNRLLVGSTTVNYSIQDGNLRPTIHAHGAYPVLTLNHTVTSNTNHGPTVQFTSNGVGNQFVIGMNGNGTQLDMGYASATDWNPHNGIAGYNGTTFFRATSGGLIGLGAQGDWGALGGGSPGYAIDTRGTLYNNTDVRAPIFYDANNTGYYGDFASTSVMNNINVAGTIQSTNGAGAIRLSGNLHIDSYSGNDIYLNYYGGNRTRAFIGTSEKFRVDTNGIVYAFDQFRTPIVYDNNDTGYYLDPASLTRLNRLYINQRNDNYNVGSINPTNAVSDWQSLTNVDGQWTVSQFNATGSYTNSPPSVYTYGSVMSWRTANHSFQLYAAHTGDLSYKTQWNNDNYTGWLYPMVYGRTNGAGGAVYGSIYYDQNDTAYYVDPNSTGTSLRVAGYGYFGLGIDGDGIVINHDQIWTPNGNFHIQYSSAGNLQLMHGGGSIKVGPFGTPSHKLHVAGVIYSENDVRAPIFYDSNNTGFYVDPAGYSKLAQLEINRGHGDCRIQLKYQHDGTDTNANSGSLTMWVSEPGLTYDCAGIGSNINVSGQYYGRQNSGNPWGVYLRFDVNQGYSEFWSTTGNVGTAGGQGSRRAFIDQNGAFYSNSEITAYYSDSRLKTKVGTLDNAVEKVKSIETFKYVNNELANSLGFTDTDVHIGVSAQSVEAVLPEIVKHAPFDMRTGENGTESISGEWYKTVQYDKLVPLLIEAIKEQQSTIEQMRTELDELRELKELVKQSLGK